MKRVCVFIDGSNTYFALKRANVPTRVDYYQLGMLLSNVAVPDDNRDLLRIYYYNAIQDQNTDPEKAKAQSGFLESLEKSPLVDVRLGRIVNRNGVKTEKGVDVRMATDMVFYSARDFFDVAVVVTEDQDFVPAINLVKEFGKQVELVLSKDAASRDMVKVADRIVWFDDLLRNHINGPIFQKQPPVQQCSKSSRAPQRPVTPDPVEIEGNVAPPEPPALEDGSPEDNVGNKA